MIIWEYRKIDDVQSIIKAEHQIENKPQIDSSNSALLSQTVQDETTNSEKYTEISTVLKENVEPVQKEVNRLEKILDLRKLIFQLQWD